MSTRGKSTPAKANSTRGGSTPAKAKSTRGRSTRGRSKRNTTSKKSGQDSGMLKAGAEMGVEKGRLTLGKLEAGAQVGVIEDEQGSGKIVAGINLGLKTDALDEIKEVADDTFDDIKSGLKTARRKLSHTVTGTDKNRSKR